MYLFPSYADMETPGRLKQFLADLYSGKLHREFHYGPDKPETSSSDAPAAEDPAANEVRHSYLDNCAFKSRIRPTWGLVIRPVNIKTSPTANLRTWQLSIKLVVDFDPWTAGP